MVKQFLPRHSQTMLDKLNQQRLGNQFCDITLLIEGEEHRAHKAVLAACSDYFKELFVEKGAVSTHEAVVDLSGEGGGGGGGGGGGRRGGGELSSGGGGGEGLSGEKGRGSYSP